ncbi:hypothetical protein EV421DRAFT_1762616 [Armillaria borealis]|uniref:Uncharacterized protein n=1 Tax=Armillaria borealis TaxID=47425 RepID=A0AA39N009_9AGAR|nr:hypothetical protein EV421DRAFT_1762616 [Armillaria borealis]
MNLVSCASVFATADSIVGVNLVQRFTCEVQIPEFRSLLMDAFNRDPKERYVLFHAFSEIPAVHSRHPVGV